MPASARSSEQAPAEDEKLVEEDYGIKRKSRLKLSTSQNKKAKAED